MKRETWAGGLLLVAIAFTLVTLYHNQPDNSAAQPPVVEKARPPSTFEGETPSLEIPALGALPDPDNLGVPEIPPSDSHLAPLASRLSARPLPSKSPTSGARVCRSSSCRWRSLRRSSGRGGQGVENRRN